MVKRFEKNEGSKKRHGPPVKYRRGGGRQAIKKGRTDEKVAARSPSPSSQDESSEEQISKQVVYTEPSSYDNLLAKLSSSSKTLTSEYKKRQRRGEGNSDTDEDDDDEEDDSDDGSESIGESEEEDAEDEGKLPENITADDGEQIKDDETEDESEASSTDQECDSIVSGQTAIESSAFTSSFNVHLEYKLKEAEVENTSKKWKYKWEVPAVNKSNFKWMGTGEQFLKDVAIESDHGLKLKLYKPWLNVFKKSGGNDLHSSEQKLFFSLCDSYRDILHCNKKPFYLKGREEDLSIMDAYIMHSLNHIFKTRDLVMTNKAKLNNQENAEKLIVGDEFRDQGFTRPKVLILLPFKHIAQRVIGRLIQLTRPAHQGNVENKDRFNEEYGTEVGEDDDQNDDLGNSKRQKPSKPSDFQELFSGNIDDHFMIGIKFTRKSVKLYNDFYKSDMIVASPLNLVTKIGLSEVDKEKDVDYLSSIEVLIIDHADVIAMQNWDHVKTVVQQLNRIPSKQHGTDIMRIRPWYLDGFARFYRQSIILGSYLNPDMNALFNHHCSSYRGKVKSAGQYKGVLPKVLLQVRQIYERFDPESIVDEGDARFEYFTRKVFPKIKDSIQGGVMLFTSSYFEYVRVRNFLKSQNASFCLLGEYTKQKDISRARVWFFEGTRKIMLYTERAHFYHRYKIRGIQNLIIYSLPERKEFYHEIVNMLEGSHNMSCTVLFSRFDQLRLERIVGTAPAKRMVTSEKAVFVFC